MQEAVCAARSHLRWKAILIVFSSVTANGAAKTPAPPMLPICFLPQPGCGGCPAKRTCGRSISTQQGISRASAFIAVLLCRIFRWMERFLSSPLAVSTAMCRSGRMAISSSQTRPIGIPDWRMCPCSSGFLMSLKSEREPSVQSCSAPPREHKRLCRKAWPLFCYVSQTCVERWCRYSSRREQGGCRPLRASMVEPVTCFCGNWSDSWRKRKRGSLGLVRQN